MRADDARPEAAGEMQPVDAFLEERITAGQLFVVAPIAGCLESPCDRGEVREDQIADRAVG
jgi:hypothetical protein